MDNDIYYNYCKKGKNVMCQPHNLFISEFAQKSWILWQVIQAQTLQMTKLCVFREEEKAPSFTLTKTDCFPSEVTTTTLLSQLMHYFTWNKLLEIGVTMSPSLYNLKLEDFFLVARPQITKTHGIHK